MIDLSGCILLIVAAFLVAPTICLERRAPAMNVIGLGNKLDRAPLMATDLGDNDGDLADPFDKRSRVSMGFVGMRGKKLNNEIRPEVREGAAILGPTDFTRIQDKSDEDPVVHLSAFHQPFYSLVDEYEPLAEKRAPRGFQGMRGKKARSLGFLGMRGKKDGLQENLMAEDNGVDNSEAINGLLNLLMAEREREAYRSKRFTRQSAWRPRGAKKAPLLGFVGMRGKRGPSSAAESTQGIINQNNDSE